MNNNHKFRNLLHWERAPKPLVRTGPELYGQLRPFRLPIILTILVMLIGSLGYMVIDDFTLMDAIYQTGITFTTVGFGEMSTISSAGRIFTIALVIGGFTIFTLAIGTIINVLNRGELIVLMKERRMLYRVARLKNHFVLCHYNEYTVEVSKQLRESHIPFVVVDNRDDLEEVSEKHHFPYYIQADPHTEIAMLKSYLTSAKGVIALSDHTADNIALIASVRLFEKEHFLPNPYYIISRAETMADVEKLQKLGADNVVSPTKLTAQRVSSMAARPDMENLLESFLSRQDTPLDMEEIFIPRKSWMVLQRLKATHLRDVTNASIVGITQKDGTFIPMPRGQILVTSESKLLVIGTSTSINAIKLLVTRSQKPKELKYV